MTLPQHITADLPQSVFRDRLAADVRRWLKKDMGKTQRWLSGRLGYSAQMVNTVLRCPDKLSDQFVMRLAAEFPDRYGCLADAVDQIKRREAAEQTRRTNHRPARNRWVRETARGIWRILRREAVGEWKPSAEEVRGLADEIEFRYLPVLRRIAWKMPEIRRRQIQRMTDRDSWTDLFVDELGGPPLRLVEGGERGTSVAREPGGKADSGGPE